MLKFQPVGFGQRVIDTPLGVMAYYTPTSPPWRSEADSGTDRPPLVFLHSLGGGSSAFEWSKVYPALAPSHRVIAPDLIGWGQSAHPVRDYRVEDYLEVITMLLEQVAQQPAIVVASSITAGVTVRLAIARPDLFQGLFLVSPSGNSDFGRNYRFSLPAALAGTPGLDRLVYSLGAANETAVTTFLSTFLFADADRITPDIVQAYLAGTQQPNAEYSALSTLKGDIAFDLSLYMSQLSLPTVFVWGQDSRFSPPEFGKRLASLNPQAVRQVYEIPQAGVLPHLEHPSVIAGLIEAFCASL
ncbi:alpha/beta hydrolase [Pseudanabaena sp. FACHB-2040]|uniref:alpha/beta fold hydrolase n=1 Tax=Pseudanabaena sp. FACHB-2040 TaxID=2692859 RepID=UPI0016884736|nr:alpha/beta hydrolase [Pseudanabaena sp. FACHB-2040]MBD2260614.1 alpha/beta hydrolase [Pseudanabaena sp. FACHB-2040]